MHHFLGLISFAPLLFRVFAFPIQFILYITNRLMNSIFRFAREFYPLGDSNKLWQLSRSFLAQQGAPSSSIPMAFPSEHSFRSARIHLDSSGIKNICCLWSFHSFCCRVLRVTHSGHPAPPTTTHSVGCAFSNNWFLGGSRAHFKW